MAATFKCLELRYLSLHQLQSFEELVRRYRIVRGQSAEETNEWSENGLQLCTELFQNHLVGICIRRAQIVEFDAQASARVVELLLRLQPQAVGNQVK